MARDPPPPTRTASYPMRAPPPSTPSREYRDGRIYEEREPSSYFDEGHRYREEEPRNASRKYDGYERERRSDTVQPDKERKSSKWPDKAANDLPFNIALKFKAKAGKAREAVKEKTREKEVHASSAKARDRDQRKERLEKRSNTQSYVEDDNASSDSDTATYVTVNRPPPRTSKSSYDSPPRPKLKPEPTRRTTSRREEDDDQEEEDKWHGRHESAREYIERSQRPGLSGRTSSSRSYWEPPEDRPSGRKSGSDSDKRPRSSKGRRPSIDIQKARPPPMPSHNSAPVGVATMKAQLDKDGARPKQRSSTGTTTSRSSPKEMPTMARSQTMPSKSRKDAVPVRGSNLKHAETHDSGYGSSGGQTPDLSGTSPPRQGPTRYQIVEDEDDVSTILVDPEDHQRRTRSPSPPFRERDRRDRPQRPTIFTDARPRSSRGATYQQSPIEIEPRSSFHRQDSARSGQARSGSPRESPPVTRHNSERGGKLFGEMDRDPYTVRYPANVKTSPRVSEKDVKYSRHARRPSTDESDRERDRDFFPYSNHREALRSPPIGLRRGSVN